MSATISNSDDTIDTRDLQERIEELQQEIDSEREMLADHPNNPDTAARQKRIDNIEQLEAELKPLLTFKEDIGESAFNNQETLISDSYFTDYIEQLIDECYEMPKEFKSGNWPWRHMQIDYEAAANEAKQDYNSAEFDGETYWFRDC